MKKWVAVAAAFVLWGTLVATPVGGAPVEDEQWPNPADATIGLHTVLIEESTRSAGAEGAVSVLASNPLSDGTFLCSSLSDAKCSQSEGYFYRAVLQPCDATVTIDCIESVSSLSGTTESQGTFKKMFPAKGVNSFAGSVADKVPNGTTPSIWTLKDAPHGFGSDYMVFVSIRGSKSPSNTPPRSFIAQIVPVSEYQTDCTPVANGHCIDTYSQGVDSTTGKAKIDFAGVAVDYGKYRCAMFGDNNMCALRHAFPAGVKYSLKVRLATEPTGWLHGRINDAVASITTNNGATTLSVTASPVKVPSIATSAMWSDLPSDLQTWFDAQCASNNCGTRVPESKGKSGPNRNAGFSPNLNDASSFDALAKWKTILKDTPSAIPSVWSVRTLAGSEMGSAPSCITRGTGVTGIVSTNATIYSQGPPSLDPATKTLQYKVATTHYEKDGATAFKGTYDLIVREDIAECLYGMTSDLAAGTSSGFSEEQVYSDEATYSATDADLVEPDAVETVAQSDAVAEELASVVDDGTSTDVINEDKTVAAASTEFSSESVVTRPNETVVLADGWFRFSANGFTFSSPTVKVKLGLVPSRSIWCAGSSGLKKVTGATPTCPSDSTLATVKYCAKGKTVNVAIATRPKCAKGFATATELVCAKGKVARRVVAVKPKCTGGFAVVKTIKCVKGTSARVVSAVSPTCANGFAKATTLRCKKGKETIPVTAVRPKCPSGYKKT